MKAPLALIVLMPFASAGCNAVGLMTVAEHKASLAVVKQAEGNESKEYLDWSAAIAQQPNAKPLPDLSAFTQPQRDAWHNSHVVRRAELDKVLVAP
jgi:hypothetical protein